MRRLSRHAMVIGMMLLPMGGIAYAQNSEISDVRAQLGAASVFNNNMLGQTGIYTGILAYRGPQEVNTWAMGSIYWPREIPYNAPTPRFFSGGVDVMTPLGVIIGIAGAGSHLNARLENAGNYSLSGTAGIVYASYSVGFWVGELTLNAQAERGKFTYSSDMNSLENIRLVPRGPLVRTLFMNAASPEATGNIEQFSASWLITQRWFQHGPTASLRVSSARLDAFAEAGTQFSRSFSDAAVSQLNGSIGYQVRFTYDKFQPFATVQTQYLFSEWGTSVLAQLVTGGPVTVSLPPSPEERNTYASQVGVRVFVTPAITAVVSWSADYHHDGRFISNAANLGFSVGF